MEENTVFQTPVQSPTSEGSPPQNQAQNQNQFLPQDEQPLPQEPPMPTPFPQTNPSVPPPVPPIDEENFNFGKIIRIGIGVIVVLLVIFLVVFLVPKLLQNKNNKVTLSYWGLWEDERTMQSITSDFQRQNPNITINYQRQDIKQYREKLSTRIVNGTGPDIFRFHSTWFPAFSDVLVPLPQDVITKKDFESNFYPVVKKDLIQNGAIYGIPLEIDTLALFVNVDIFDAAGASPPTTWEDFLRLSRQLTVKDESGKIKTAGAAMGTFDNITHAPDIVSMLFFQNGADINNLGGTSKQASDALSFYNSFSSGDSNVWDNTLDSSLSSFAKGNLAMYFGYSWDYFTIKATNPQLNFLIAKVPSLPGQSTTTASYWAEGVSSKSKNQKEAFTFMKYLTTKEAQQKLFSEASKTRLFGEPYSRRDLASLLSDSKYIKPFIDEASNANSSFFAGDTYDNGLNSQMNAYLGNAVRSMQNGGSAESAVDTLSKGVTQVLSQYAKKR